MARQAYAQSESEGRLTGVGTFEIEIGDDLKPLHEVKRPFPGPENLQRAGLRLHV